MTKGNNNGNVQIHLTFQQARVLEAAIDHYRYLHVDNWVDEELEAMANQIQEKRDKATKKQR